MSNKEDRILELTQDVKWVGVLDPDIRTFDVVMETKYGTTYNSYFVNAAKKAIIETTKENFLEPYLDKLRRVTNPADIEFIILNHTEPDHSGNLAKLLELAPKATVVSSGNGIRYLKDLMYPDFPNIVVKDGSTLDLGNKTLRFISAPNLHWPDTMFTYLEEDKILFTCDAFGCHYCNEVMYDDLAGDFDDAFKYYFDVILSPFSKFMLKAVERIQDLDIRMIAPGHGPILRTNWKKYVGLAGQYAMERMKLPIKQRVFIPYVSAYHKTAMLAGKIAEGLRHAGPIEVDLVDIEKTSAGEMDQKVAQSSGIIVGCPTFNQNILLPVYKLFAVINPLRDKGKLAGGFGSYGWSGEGKDIIRAGLENLKLRYHGEGIYAKFTPNAEALDMAFTYGKTFGEELLKAGD
jgi:flavorubredoxin